MLESLPVQVEVAVQDCFFEAAGLDAPVSEAEWQIWFQQWLKALAPNFLQSPIFEGYPGVAEHQEYELSLRLTNDAEIQLLNAQYRHKDQPTDVLAFAALETDYPQLEDMAEQPLYLGDIVISVETAQTQAQQHPLRHELAWLGAHALLHLLGWDHPDEENLMLMLKQQERLLQLVGLQTERLQSYYHEAHPKA
ncbi:MAG: rRNA maturation RNase YbeY [Drouetiella hepatica Uher 2000/2452]|jgi:probable rRNA maturation factor|uniref:Endoribonuclease YbeY n=1 Tax=Drouetiella hepatica Uher 2000/2452 TaxID=904376 RepID=A0A951UN39_9CYAN|nr:rRNA maturation RNase YbeY [Drouetiella hepatica Uher 2000/2452]